jgi:homoserine dehydrogenase
MSASASTGEPSFSSPFREALRVGLLGCGTVGSRVAKALLEDGPALARSAGIPLELARVAVRHPEKARPVDLPPGIVTTDALSIAIDPDIDIVVEVMGGIEPALTSIKAALGDRKSVVTANKEVLAGPGAGLIDDPDADLHFEASVCGAVPIVRALRDSCAGDEVQEIAGIFNGTSNFMLTKMKEGCSFDQALSEARRLGYAEADPTADIEGFDAAAKTAILSRIAFGVPIGMQDVRRCGISGIDRDRVRAAEAADRRIRLVGRARRTRSGLDLRVGPEFLEKTHPLTAVEGVRNAVLVTTRRAGVLEFHGAGAGGDATAAAVLGDVVISARRRLRARKGPICMA